MSWPDTDRVTVEIFSLIEFQEASESHLLPLHKTGGLVDEDNQNSHDDPQSSTVKRGQRIMKESRD
jgi:hypothetical protein